MSVFKGAHHFHIENLVQTAGAGARTAIERLHEYVSSGALHNSDERCDAPKCHPETRVAIIDEIVSWVEEGDNDADPKDIVWMTGPAGTGKTAIAGSVADACKEKGTLAASFFFSSYSKSADRRSKRCLVATLAYQLCQVEGLQQLSEAVQGVIERDPAIFKKQLKEQLEALILAPLRRLHQDQFIATGRLPKLVVIDGLDECEAEQYEDTRRSARSDAARRNEQDQLEVLSILLRAAKDPSFPFRILLVSRPERAISNFFEKEGYSITRKVFLDEKYKPDADIALFLESKFAEIRRKYRLPASWPTDRAIKMIVDNASGQFIYAATVIRYVETGSDPPEVQLERVLGFVGAGPKPFGSLNALYAQIMGSSPNPVLAAAWIVSVCRVMPQMHQKVLRLFRIPAITYNTLLATNSGEAEHLLGPLASLIQMPAPEDHVSCYKAYHKSLWDFLRNDGDPVSVDGISEPQDTSALATELLASSIFRVLKNKGPPYDLDVEQQDRDEFLSHFLILLPRTILTPEGSTASRDPELLQCDVGWWIARCLLSRPPSDDVYHLFCPASVISSLLRAVHSECEWWRCHRICKAWRTSIHKTCRKHGWKIHRQRMARFKSRFTGPEVAYITMEPPADVTYKYEIQVSTIKEA